MMATSEWTFIVPGDPNQNTGGYRYVRQLAAALNESGQPARLVGLEGRFPRPDQVALNAMEHELATLPDGATVILDGLAMSAMPEVLARHSERLILVGLVHHPLADEAGLSPDEQDWFFNAEKQALTCVGTVITTSRYTARRLRDFGVTGERIVTAEPAVDDGVFAVGDSRSGQSGSSAEPPRLLYVAHLSERKAQHQLLQSLAALKKLGWHCTLAGSATRSPAYGERIRSLISELGLQARVTLTGELDEPALLTAYQNADLFVFPSTYEGYGMVVDEALAAGLPVLSSDGGALADTADKPGAVTFAAGDAQALEYELKRLLTDSKALSELRQAAMAGRRSLRRWADVAEDIKAGLSAMPESSQFSGDWLSLREGADHRARHAGFTQALADWLAARYDGQAGAAAETPMHLADMGTGRGSNPVHLVRRLPVPQRWTLIEPDPRLAGVAKTRIEAEDVPVTLIPRALTADNLDALLPVDLDLITASALIDLVSRPWLQALARAVVRRRAATLIVLSYSGHFRLTPEHPGDHRLAELVNAHQHSDKGSGAALGPDAAPTLQALLQAEGYQVSLAPSPWRLEGTRDTGLMRELMEGWVQAACEQSPADAEALKHWQADRLAHLTAGELQIEVDHWDLMALPGGEAHG